MVINRCAVVHVCIRQSWDDSNSATIGLNSYVRPKRGVARHRRRSPIPSRYTATPAAVIVVVATAAAFACLALLVTLEAGGGVPLPEFSMPAANRNQRHRALRRDRAGGAPRGGLYDICVRAPFCKRKRAAGRQFKRADVLGRYSRAIKRLYFVTEDRQLGNGESVA